jgi:hypothetical protein
MYEAEALRMMAHDLVDRVTLLEAAPRKVADEAAAEGIDVIALLNAKMKTIEGQRKHIATLEKKLKAYESSVSQS